MKNIIMIVLMTVLFGCERHDEFIETVVLDENGGYGELAFYCAADDTYTCQRKCMVNYSGSTLTAEENYSDGTPVKPGGWIDGGGELHFTIKAGWYEILTQVTTYECVDQPWSYEEIEYIHSEFTIEDGGSVTIEF